MTLLANKTEDNPKLRKKITLDNDKKDLSKLLDDKRAYFIKNVFPKYDLIEKSDYIEKNDLNNPNIYSVTTFTVGVCLLFTSPIKLLDSYIAAEYFQALNLFLCLSFGILCVSLMHIKIFQKFTSKRWLKKEKNRKILENDMFWNTSVDKETMKYVVQCYGKEHFVNLMKGKENLKYKDVFYYVKQLDNESAETAKLSKVAECLLKN